MKNSEISGVLKIVCVILFLIAGASYALWFSDGGQLTVYSKDGSPTGARGAPTAGPDAVSRAALEVTASLSPEPSGSAAMTDIRVNINTADIDELKTLTGIGDSKAAAIVAYREANGDFTSIEDIMMVPGIKEGVFGKIKDSICVSADTGEKSVQ